jgi:hypothetical protein
MAVGAYLMVSGMADLVRRPSPVDETAAPRRALALGRRVMSGFWDTFLLLLGAAMAASGMLLLYSDVFG